MRCVFVCTMRVCTEVADQHDLLPGLRIAASLACVGGGSPRLALV